MRRYIEEGLDRDMREGELSPKDEIALARMRFFRDQKTAATLHMLGKGALDARTRAETFERQKGKKYYRFSPELEAAYIEAERDLEQTAFDAINAYLKAKRKQTRKSKQVIQR